LAIDKLYALVNGEIQPENLDSMGVHEALLPGHLYLMILREKLEETLSYVRAKIMKDASAAKILDTKLISIENIKKLL
jgi:DNA-directed RNA polymerase I subunit RPA2